MLSFAGEWSWIHVGYDSARLLAKASNWSFGSLFDAALDIASVALHLHLPTLDTLSQWHVCQTWQGVPAIWDLCLRSLLLLPHKWVFWSKCEKVMCSTLVLSICGNHMIVCNICNESRQYIGKPKDSAHHLQSLTDLSKHLQNMLLCCRHTLPQILW